MGAEKGGGERGKTRGSHRHDNDVHIQYIYEFLQYTHLDLLMSWHWGIVYQTKTDQ